MAQKKNKKTKKVVKKKKLTSKASSSSGGRKLMLKYVFGFISLIILFYVVYSSSFFEQNIVEPLSAFQTKIASGILNVFSYGTSATDGMLQSDGIALDVAKGCDGMEPLALFIVGLLLVPFSLRLKLVGLAWGVGILFLLNILRIAGLYIAKVHFPSAFEFLHLHGGFAIFTVITIVIWAVWAQWAMNQQQKITPNATT